MVDEERRKERLDRGIKARTEGLYAVTSWREVGYLLMPRAGLILVLLAAPLVVPGLYWQRVLGLAAPYRGNIKLPVPATSAPVAEILKNCRRVIPLVSFLLILFLFCTMGLPPLFGNEGSFC